jgi:pyruvyl transferase EpsO
MTYLQRLSELKRLILENITPLVTNDYIYLDAPYYSNVGDVLIWQGSLDLLKRLPYKCLYSASINNYVKPNIDKNTIILLQGGGNFGDLWHKHQEFRIKVLKDFPDNKILLLPQSVHYSDERTLLEDAKEFNSHKYLTMCFRDKKSFETANKYFTSSCNILMPDMAFNMDIELWKSHIKPVVKNKILFLDRKDCEKNTNENYGIVPDNAENHDWPTIEKPLLIIRIFYKITYLFSRIDNMFIAYVNNKISDFVSKRILRKYYIRKGIRFISQYDYIYTTRLHTGILAFMLGKKFAFFDNSYGKNRGVYLAWLKDADNVTFIGK